MDLKTFVAETLRQLIEGVVEAQDHAGKHNARVCPQTSTGTQSWGGHPVDVVEFDVAITVTGGQETGGKLGIAWGMISLGKDKKETTTDTTVSRVKFTIPVGWPTEGVE